MNLALAYPWALLLAPLALIPLLARNQKIQHYPYAPLIPEDGLSTAFDWLVRLVAGCTIATLVLAMAGPYRRQNSLTVLG